MPNRLSSESSPYLLQHAENPVDWYPWGEEALEKALREDRPILVSIGYSSCHWCHVMERESFEDPATAELMNSAFVNIKVDREERPDVDQVYMKAVQAMTGSGGWPLTVFLTPMQEPYYGGTYFPPEPRHGLPSFSQVLVAAADAYASRREDVKKASAGLLEVLRGPQGSQSADVDLPGEPTLNNAVRTLARQYDAVNGGFGRAPKFPQPVTLELLLRHYTRTGETNALQMCVHTLRRMAAGGMRDHLAGGFHRYSVDARWLVPHFEKMLYDNALLARAYLDAYRVTGEGDLRQVAEETLDYLLADMRSPDGAFYTARDADSEGEEGLFYVWKPEEVRQVLDGDEARLFMRCYDVSSGGNFEGRSILHLPHDLEVIANSEGMEPDALHALLVDARGRLLAFREERVPPMRDEKILLSWNSLTLRAFAEAGRTLARPDYLRAATTAADFLLEHMRIDGALRHTFKDGRAGMNGFLEDYGALGNALLSLYEATLEERWLEEIRWCCDGVLDGFWAEEEAVLYDTAADAQPLVVRPRDAMDNATPSGTSLALELLTRASHLFDEPRFRSVVDAALGSQEENLTKYPPAFGRLLSVLDRRLAPPTEVAVVGDPALPETQELAAAAWQSFHRNLTVAGADPEQGDPALPLLEGRPLVDGRPAAYVCEAYTCQAPVTDPGAVTAAVLGNGGS